MRFAEQMLAVAVGWQVYSIHRNPLDLGLIGLAEFLPLPLLALPAGQLADRLPRKLIAAFALLLNAGVASALVVVTLHGARSVWPFFALAASTGVASAIGWPAFGALTPELVPTELLPGAMALRSIAGQAAVVVGPAAGGFLFAARPELVYVVAACLFGVALVALLALRRRASVSEVVGEGPPGFESLIAGVRFVLRTRMLLGAIALDLFAVLFGGATALLPVFARSILHVGPVGLGVLRTAPAAGALVAAVILARRPLRFPAGPTLIAVVGAFGVSMIVFGVSRWLPVSLAALAVGGFVDMISVNIRSTTVALITPNELRGRVNAVEMVFVSASNELGAFESGVIAALIGTVTAVVAGGAATVAVALSWTRLFPALSRMGRLEDLRPEPVSAEVT
ncbi:MAG: major facilitator superfamily 1 [Actinomycetia bacterium]|nr:major facilitator superfamily 1 [Actinomycetes bacterium]